MITARSITRLRYERTLQSNRIRRHIEWMLTSRAPYLGSDGLPSWWPFWAESLATSVRDLVRIARKLEAEER